MKAILLLNGEPYAGEIDTGDKVVYCCDGAYSWAKNKVKIDKNIGDFDSLSEIPNPPPEEIYPSEKDCTDGEIAMKKLIEEGAESVTVYGGGGGREDHFLGNLQLLYLGHISGVICEMVTNNSIIFPADDEIFLGKYKGKTFSVLPFGGPSHIISYRGLKYAYPERLTYGNCRGISNIVTDDNAFLHVNGPVLVFINTESI
ncbi:MAG: thiamine diphosphokinase [Clostridiales bacterium]|nr:thiamine diphosphokinase [Clostridiales bacterium]